MALFFWGKVMQVRRFEFEMEQPRGDVPSSPPDAIGEVVCAGPDAEDDDQRNPESIEEPGYGHGV